MIQVKILKAEEWSHIDQREIDTHYEYIESDTGAYRLSVANGSGIGYHWMVERAIACNWHLSGMSQVYWTDFAPALNEGRAALCRYALRDACLK